MTRIALISALTLFLGIGGGVIGVQLLYAQQARDPRVADLVQAGKLRVGLGLGSAVLAIKDPATGEVRGPALDLARALAARIGVEVQPVQYEPPDLLLKGARTNAWDVAFLQFYPTRASEADFSPPYLRGDVTCLVLASSPIRTAVDVDQPGVRIVMTHVSPTAGYPLVLKHAQLVYADTIPAALDMVRTGRADAQAAPRPLLLAEVAQPPGFRVLEGQLGFFSYAALVPKGHADRLAYVSEFIEDAKASGLVKQIIERYGLQGVEVSPAQK